MGDGGQGVQPAQARSPHGGVGPGEVVGLLGANGAGKTTLIRLLLGLLRPSSGVALLFGAAPSAATRRRVGYVPQPLGRYGDLTVAENWSFTAAAFGSAPAAPPGGIGAGRDELVGELPLGIQRRVAFATTHGMEEAQECDRLVVMADGRVVAGGTTAGIIGGATVTEVRCEDWRRAFGLLDAAGFGVQVHGQRVLRVPGAAAAVRGALAAGGLGAAAVQEVPANLDEAFVAIVGGAA